MGAAELAPTTRVLLDCRWLGRGGPGRATELLLRGLQEVRPAGRWILWGPEDVGGYGWDGAEQVLDTVPPERAWGQAPLRLPTHDIVVYLHQIRPFRGRRPVTLIHDTIPLRYGGRLERTLKRMYLRAIVARSRSLVTVSEYSRACIARDLGLDPVGIRLVRYPVDEQLIARVKEIRAQSEPHLTVLAVGRDAPHKNLDRLIEGFAMTSCATDGASLALIGIQEGSRERLASLAATAGAPVRILGVVPQPELEAMYATSRALVMPSLEEGFGLPAWEAMACGLPVALANAGSLPEIGRGVAHLFDPTSPADIAAAVDAAVSSPSPPPAPAITEAPSVSGFAAGLIDAVSGSLE